jgi:thymidylate kinase
VRDRILDAMAAAGVRAVALHGGGGRDLDLVAAPFERAPAALATIPGFVLVQAIRYGAGAVTCVLRHDGAWLPVDIVADVRIGGVLYLSGAHVLARARDAPAPADDFAYYLAKRLHKRSLGPAEAASLAALLARDEAGCRRALDRLLPAEDHDAALRAIREADGRDVRRLRRAMLRHGLRARLGTLRPFATLAWLAERLARPTGFLVAVLGPDGAGKSTLVDGLARAFDRAFWRTRRRHLRPQLLRRGGRPTGDPHGRSPRGPLASLFQALLWLADYRIGHPLTVYPSLVRTTLVLFDRYADDLAVDPRRYRFGGPAGLAALVARLAPRPDVTLVLGGTSGDLGARKREVPEAELRRQLTAYAALADTCEDVVVLDAARPPEEILAAAVEAIVARLARRTASRLGLDR